MREDLHVGPVESVHPARWDDRRVLLIGDAAPASLPHLGQCGAMAVEDAGVLADTLAATDDIATALHTFTARRRRRVNWVQEESRSAARGWVLPPAVRDAALRQHGDQLLRDRYRPLITAP